MPRIIGLALVVFFAVVPHRADACSCERNPTAAGILERAAAVFTGTVQQSEALPVRSSDPLEHSVTTFRVLESFKGARAGDIVRIVHRSGSSASCGVTFSVGQAYTLEVQRDGADLTTSLCATWLWGKENGDALIREMRALSKR